MVTADWILLSLIFYGGVFAMTAFHVFVVRKASLFEPVGQYLLFVSLFTLPLPVRASLTMDVEGDVSPFLPEFASFLPLAVVLTAMSLPLFTAAYYSRVAQRLGEWLPLLAQRSLGGTRLGVILLVALATALIYELTAEIGGIEPFLLLGYKSTEATFGRGYLAVGFPWLLVAMMLLLERYVVGRSWLDLLGFACLLLANLAIHTLTWNRNLILYLALVLGIYIHYRVRHLSLAFLLPVALAGFVALNVVGILRHSEYTGIRDFAELTSHRAEALRGGDSDEMFYTLTVGEFVVPFETFPQVIRRFGVSDWPWMGWSYLRAPVFFIPSKFYEERPLPLGNWYMEEFYGGGYGLNEGRAFFFLAEAYLNFGPVGILLVAVAWGFFWGGLHRWMVRGRERFATVVIYAFLVGFMYRCIGGEFVTLLVGATQQSLVAILLVLLVARIFGTRRVPRASAARL